MQASDETILERSESEIKEVYEEGPATLDVSCLTAELLGWLGIEGGIQARGPHLELREDGYHSNQCAWFEWDDAIPLNAAQIAYLQWDYHWLHHECFEGVALARSYGTQFNLEKVNGFKECFGAYDPLAALEGQDGDTHRAQAQRHLDLARRWAVLHVALCVPGGVRQDDNTIDGAVVLHAMRSGNMPCHSWISDFFHKGEKQACESLLSDSGKRAADEQLLHDVQQLRRTTGAPDQVVTHGAYLWWDVKRQAYYTECEEPDILEKGKQLDLEQVAFLQWKWHNMHARRIASCREDKEDQDEFVECFGRDHNPCEGTGSNKATGKQAQAHRELAQRWLIVYIALHEGAIDQTTGDINKPAVWTSICSISDRDDWPKTVKHALREEQDAYRKYLLPIPLACVAMGCVLAAVACGACVWAMPLLWPSVLGTAGHWAMVGVAAASGAAMMGYDIRSQSEWSWARVLCGALVLGILAAGVGALSHVALPWLAATCAWSAGATAASGASLTLFAMCGLGGLAGRVRGEKKISP